MTGDTSLMHRADDSTSDQRWAAWVAKGAEHDRKMTSHVIAIALAVTALVAATILLVG
jgi:hypothetical protein